MCGESLVCKETIGSLTALAGDWDRGVAHVLEARARNPYCAAHAGLGLWAHHLRRGELAASYIAALDHQDATSFWRELMCACSLGLLGRTGDAQAGAAALLRLKPEFPLRADALISRYIKNPDLHQLVVDGLRLAGVRLRA